MHMVNTRILLSLFSHGSSISFLGTFSFLTLYLSCNSSTYKLAWSRLAKTRALGGQAYCDRDLVN